MTVTVMKFTQLRILSSTRGIKASYDVHVVKEQDIKLFHRYTDAKEWNNEVQICYSQKNKDCYTGFMTDKSFKSDALLEIIHSIKKLTVRNENIQRT